MSFYLRQAWRDSRLAFPHEVGKKQFVKLDASMLRKLWIPDTFFRNEKYAYFHDITSENTLIRVNFTGDVWYVTK